MEDRVKQNELPDFRTSSAQDQPAPDDEGLATMNGEVKHLVRRLVEMRRRSRLKGAPENYDLWLAVLHQIKQQDLDRTQQGSELIDKVLAFVQEASASAGDPTTGQAPAEPSETPGTPARQWERGSTSAATRSGSSGCEVDRDQPWWDAVQKKNFAVSVPSSDTVSKAVVSGRWAALRNALLGGETA